MAKITIKFDDVVIDQLVIKPGDMSIGRRPGSDILLDNLAVSGNHATIFTVGEDSFIQDLNSTNGTFVNNVKITKHHLKDGDTVVIGKHALVYNNENAARAPADNLAKTMIITPPRKADDAVTDPRPAAGAEPRRGSIFVLSGANSGKRIEITKAVTNLGHGGKVAGVINRNASGGYILVPGGQGELLKLNGNPVPGRGETLKNGDVIEIAGSRMQFYLK
ncbi:MAG TPA: FHA domain-containing protein [Acidiferrobacterales bacterium]|jgi:hypothetical protein